MLDSHDDENASRLSLIQKAIDESPVIAPVEYATNQAEKRSKILRIVYIALVVLDCALIVFNIVAWIVVSENGCLLYTSPSPRDRQKSRMPSSA